MWQTYNVSTSLNPEGCQAVLNIFVLWLEHSTQVLEIDFELTNFCSAPAGLNPHRWYTEAPIPLTLFSPLNQIHCDT